MATDDIFNVLRVDDRLLTAGQPSEQQLRDAADEGVEAVLNIAPVDPRYSLDDEPGAVRAAGMEYAHLPVAWDNPTAADFRQFVTQMDAWSGRHLLVHCAANYRVSAFYSLYAMLRFDWSAGQADDFIAARWNPADYPPWPEFIDATRRAIEAGEFDRPEGVG